MNYTKSLLCLVREQGRERHSLRGLRQPVPLKRILDSSKTLQVISVQLGPVGRLRPGDPEPSDRGHQRPIRPPLAKESFARLYFTTIPPVCQEFFSLNIFIPSTGPVQIAENPYGFGTKPHNQTPVLCHMTVTNNHPKIHSDENYFHNAHTFFTFFNINP